MPRRGRRTPVHEPDSDDDAGERESFQQFVPQTATFIILTSTAMAIHLDWEGPHSFRSMIIEHRLHFNEPGVYLWKRIDGASPEIIYVGRSNGSLYQRQMEHYHLFVGCGYEIPGYFSDGRPWQMLLDRKEMMSVCFNEESFIELARKGFHFANRLEIYAARLADPVQRAAAERILIYTLQPERNRRGKAECLNGDVLENTGALEHINAGLLPHQALSPSMTIQMASADL